MVHFEKVYNYSMKWEVPTHLVERFIVKVKKNNDKIDYVEEQSREVYIGVTTKFNKSKAKRIYGNDIIFDEEE